MNYRSIDKKRRNQAPQPHLLDTYALKKAIYQLLANNAEVELVYFDTMPSFTITNLWYLCISSNFYYLST